MNHWDEKLETTVPQSRPQDNGPIRGLGQRTQHLDLPPVPLLCHPPWHPCRGPLKGQAGEATKEPRRVGSSCVTLPLCRLPLDELLFNFRPLELVALHSRDLEPDHMVQHLDILCPFPTFSASPVQHSALANSCSRFFLDPEFLLNQPQIWEHCE